MKLLVIGGSQPNQSRGEIQESDAEAEVTINQRQGYFMQVAACPYIGEVMVKERISSL